MKLTERLISFTKAGRESLQAQRDLSMLLKKGMDIKKAQKLTAKLVNKYDGLKENDIRDWRNAHAAALDSEKPIRYDLYTIYRDTLLDDHLKSVIKVRLEKVLKNEFQIVNDKDGSIDVEATNYLKRRWFWQFMTYAWNANLYGYTLIQFGDIIKTDKGFEFKDVEEVDRRFLRPEKNQFVLEPYDESGFPYDKGNIANWLLEVGDKKDLGLLLEATPLAISKKYMGIFWDEFGEMFAAPIRVGKTNINNNDERSKVADMLEQMGRNAWGVFDTNTDIEIIETQKKDAYMVYDKRIERLEKGMSKLVVGNTMTTDDGSSHSQSQVHLEITEDIVDSDKRELMFTINEELIPFLIMHGYPLQGKSFKWDDREYLNLKDQADVDKWLLEYFDIDVDYFKSKYNSSIIDYKKQTSNDDGLGK